MNFFSKSQTIVELSIKKIRQNHINYNVVKLCKHYEKECKKMYENVYAKIQN